MDRPAQAHPTPATNLPPQPTPPPPPVDLYELLWEEPGSNPARAVLRAALHLDAASADFLAACIYWYLVMDGPFWKFNQPPAQEPPQYRAGDSWLEELGIGPSAFYRARAQVATKNTTGHTLKTTLASTDTETLVIYWTTHQGGTRLTWYDVRLDLLCAKLGQALGLTVTAHQRPPRVQRTLQATLGQSEVTPVAAFPSAPTAPIPSRAPNPAPTLTATLDGAAHPDPDRECEVPMKPAQPVVTYSISLIKEEEIEREGDKEVSHMAAKLQELGVYPQPALNIARRAHARGLDAAATCEIYYTLYADVRITKPGKQPHDWRAMTVDRMQTWPLERLPALATLDPTRQRFLAEMQELPTRVTEVRPDGLEGTATDMEPSRTKEEPTAATAPENAPLDPNAEAQQRLWRTVLADLQLQMTRATFETWLKSTRLSAVEEGCYTIAVRDQRAVAWLANRLDRQIERTLAQHVGQPVVLAFMAHPENAP